MASLFGEVATSLGGTIKELGQQKREDQLADEEEQRQMQLQKMRMQHDSSLLDKRIGADNKRETRRQEWDKTQAELATEQRLSEQEAEHTQRTSEAQLKSQTDIVTTWLSNYMRSTKSRSMSGEGWKIGFEERQSFDPDTGQPVYSDIVNATSPSGRPYRVAGDMAFEAGGPTTPKTVFKTADEKRQAEAGLYLPADDPKNVTVETFRDIHGYVPSDYIFGKVTRDEQNIRGAMESAGIRLPAWGMKPSRSGSGDRKGGKESDAVNKIRDEGTSGSPPIRLRPDPVNYDEDDENALPRGDTSKMPTLDEALPQAGAQQADQSRRAGMLADAERLSSGGNLEPPPDQGPPAPELTAQADPNRTPYGGKYAQGKGAGAAIYNQSPVAQRLFPMGGGGEITDEQAAAIAAQVAADMAATGTKVY